MSACGRTGLNRASREVKHYPCVGLRVKLRITYTHLAPKEKQKTTTHILTCSGKIKKGRGPTTCKRNNTVGWHNSNLFQFGHPLYLPISGIVPCKGLNNYALRNCLGFISSPPPKYLSKNFGTLFVGGQGETYHDLARIGRPALM